MLRLGRKGKKQLSRNLENTWKLLHDANKKIKELEKIITKKEAEIVELNKKIKE